MDAAKGRLMTHRETALSVIARITGVDRGTITTEMELVADLGLDSAKAFELLVELEDRIGIEIDDDQAARLNTVGDIVAYVDRATAG